MVLVSAYARAQTSRIFPPASTASMSSSDGPTHPVFPALNLHVPVINVVMKREHWQEKGIDTLARAARLPWRIKRCQQRLSSRRAVDSGCPHNHTSHAPRKLARGPLHRCGGGKRPPQQVLKCGSVVWRQLGGDGSAIGRVRLHWGLHANHRAAVGSGKAIRISAWEARPRQCEGREIQGEDSRQRRRSHVLHTDIAYASASLLQSSKGGAAAAAAAPEQRREREKFTNVMSEGQLLRIVAENKNGKFTN